MRIKSFIKKTVVGVMIGGMLCTSVFANGYIDKHNELYKLRSEGNYLECVALADSILTENPNYMGAYTNKALAAYQYGDFRTSYETLEKQLEINPYNATALYNKACLASVITDYQTAETAIKLLMDMDIGVKKMIMLDSDFVNCHENEYMVNLLFNPTIRVCGTVLDPNTPPIEQDERLLVPVRPVVETMGAVLEWNSDDNSFAVIKDGKNLVMQIGSKVAKLNGEIREVELAPILNNDRAYVPVRFVAETFGFDVKWSEEMGLVDIYTKVPDGNLSYDEFSSITEGGFGVSAVFGTHISPYMLNSDEGIVMAVMNDDEVFDCFNRLSHNDKKEFLKQLAIENSADFEGGRIINVRLIRGNMTYYTMDYNKENGDFSELLYFENGLLTNVVTQIREENNYMDYYLYNY